MSETRSTALPAASGAQRILDGMALDIAAVQAALSEDGLDGWLLYDFHGSNPIARSVVGLNGGGKMTTRRWYYLIPASGEPRALVHAIEPHTLDGLPGHVNVYAGREALAQGLDGLMRGVHRVAMEYSPGSAIPYIGRVDAGTVEAIRHRGVDVVSSGDLVQRFEAIWDEHALATHLDASAALYRIKDRAFAAAADEVAAGRRFTEYDLQQRMVGWFQDEGLIADDPPVVASMEHAGNPHYIPQATGSRTVGRDELLLLDLWGKRPGAGSVYADITWVGFTGARVPDEFAAAFAAIARARDAAVALIRTAAAEGRDLRGWQVDRAAREVLTDAGYGAHVLHRTGHSLGTEVHGNGVHMDDYETHDDRRLLPGTGFTVEPGLYFDRFGVRTEINVFFGRGEARVSGPAQAAIVALAR
jgi:Xaa-Pro dipeptidase